MKKNRLFRYVVVTSYLLVLPFLTYSQEKEDALLPGEKNSVPALSYDYFPSRVHAFVWRNWFLIPDEHLAEVLQTSKENVEKIALSMGLPVQPELLPEWSGSRGYITVIRRNWHLLPYEQLLRLLKMSRQELAWRLIEDDFLIVKLGTKPFCEPLIYASPTKEMERRAHEIAGELTCFGEDIFDNEVPRFSFMREFQQAVPATITHATGNKRTSEFDLRIISSYFTDFGDPLMDPELSSFPEGLLQRLAESGVNGIWIHSVLRMLVAPKGIFPGAEDYKQRMEGLQKLVKRAAKYGIGIYLYTNEPRAMSVSFFTSSEERKKFGGVKEGDMQAFCTSHPEVLEWLSSALEEVFRTVPGLAGVFTITASENLTSCASHHKHSDCPMCSKSTSAQLITDINKAIEKGVKRGNPNAQVLVWDWGWKDTDAPLIIEKLPKSCWFMSVSEWSLPIERGGVKSTVGEYSISSVGPGPRAKKHWELAKQAGLKTVAKVQVNCTWEMAVVPSLPVMDLVAEHADNLKRVSTDGVLLSWSLGGYPSVNLEVFQSIKPGKREEALDSIATLHYGEQPASFIRKAWSSFSEAFREYPYHVGTVYFGPQHAGPSNPLFTYPTGYRATMVGFPYDDLDSWRAIYPPDIWITQMDKMAKGFQAGCDWLEEAQKVSPDASAGLIETDILRANAVRIHFSSCADQAGFIYARNRYLSSEKESEKKELLAEMRKYILSEQKNIKDIFPILKKDPTIGYESSNQYFYLPVDLLEKQINLNALLRWIDEQVK